MTVTLFSAIIKIRKTGKNFLSDFCPVSLLYFSFLSNASLLLSEPLFLESHFSSVG